MNNPVNWNQFSQGIMSDPFIHLGLGILAGGEGSYGSFGQQLGQGALTGIISANRAQEWAMRRMQERRKQEQQLLKAQRLQRQQELIAQATQELPKNQQALAQAFPTQWAQSQFRERPNSYQEWQAAAQQGYPGSYVDFLQMKKPAGTSVTVSPVTKVGPSMASQIGPMMKEGQAAAEGASEQYRAADRLLAAIESPDVFVGPGAGIQQALGQIGVKAGWAGDDTVQSVENTRRVIQSLAEFTLQSRGMLAGQGQITENEQRLLERARSGEFDEMTKPELRQIARIAKRSGLRVYNKQARRIKKAKNLPDLAPLADFFEIPSLETGQYENNQELTNEQLLELYK